MASLLNKKLIYDTVPDFSDPLSLLSGLWPTIPGAASIGILIVKIMSSLSPHQLFQHRLMALLSIIEQVRPEDDSDASTLLDN